MPAKKPGMIRAGGEHMYCSKKYTCNSFRKKNLVINSFGQEAVNNLNLCENNCDRNGVLYGRVINKFGQPIKSAIVKIVSETYEPLLIARTDCSGIYFIFDVPANRRCKVIAAADNHSLNDEIEIFIKEWEILKIDIFLSCNGCDDMGVVTGTVWSRLNSLPIGRAHVVLYSETRGGQSFKKITDTNEFGEFALTKLPPGAYLVKICGHGYYSRQYRVIITRCRQIVNLVISLCPDCQEWKGTVSGVITDQHQTPIADADVILFKVKNDGKTEAVAYTKTNRNGVYMFINVETGSYQVSAK